MMASMRELHGVIEPSQYFSTFALKQQAFLFDKLHMIGLEGFIAGAEAAAEDFGYSPEFTTELQFLRSVKFLNAVDWPRINKLVKATHKNGIVPDQGRPQLRSRSLIDLFSRDLEAKGIEAVGIFNSRRKVNFGSPLNKSGREQVQVGRVLQVAFSALPVPHEDCPWQDILEFRNEVRDKKWAFRRFLKSLATKELAELELREEVEWMVSEYTKAMQIHRLKASRGFIDVFIVSPLEIIENLLKFNWSKIAKGAVSVKQRKIELLEAELKAPGKECAYVFEARKRFGAK